jgi:RNA polymerase sigma-70 factor, ECF subfamily
MDEDPPAAKLTLIRGDAGTGEIVRRIRSGETRHYAEIVRRYQTDVLRIIGVLLHDPETTQSLAQQCFVKAFERLHQFQEGRDFGFWIRSIARNVALDELRRLRREARRLSAYADHLLATLADDHADDERRQRVEEALRLCREGLQPDAARALELRYAGSLPLETVAAELGRSVTATRQLLYRVRQALRACVERRLAAV